MAVIITTRKRNLKRILPRVGNPNSMVRFRWGRKPCTSIFSQVYNGQAGGTISILDYWYYIYI